LQKFLNRSVVLNYIILLELRISIGFLENYFYGIIIELNGIYLDNKGLFLVIASGTLYD